MNVLISGLFVLSIGLFTGYSMGHYQAKTTAFPAVKWIKDLNQGVSTVKFLSFEGGTLRGQIEGQKTRLAYSTDDIQDLKPGESFEIPVKEIDLASFYGAQNLPAGTAYIASKTGKYFYHILDPRALRITPKNRVYFLSEAVALSAGYQPRQ